MLDQETRAEIKREIEKNLNIILSGLAGVNTMTAEDITDWFPNAPTITQRPVMHPYGFSSRAPLKTLQVVGQQGSHPGNKLVLGHRDAAAPSVSVGESVQYSVGGYQVVCKNSEILIGKGGVYERAVVGDTLVALLTAILDAVVAHTHLGNLGYPTGVPINASDFTDLITQYLANNKILATDGGRF